MAEARTWGSHGWGAPSWGPSQGSMEEHSPPPRQGTQQRFPGGPSALLWIADCFLFLCLLFFETGLGVVALSHFHHCL